MKRLLAKAGVAAMFLGAVLVPAGAAQADPYCDRPIPPPACNENPDPTPIPRDLAAHGSLDGVTYVGNAVNVGGWAYDANSGSAPLLVDIWIDGVFARTLTANTYRPDVAAVHPTYGSYRGYEATVPAGLGTHQVCAYAISVVPQGAPHPGNPQLGCKTYTAKLAAPTNLRTVSRDAATGISVLAFGDNAVEEAGFQLTIRTQHWRQRNDPRWGQVWEAYYTSRTIAVPALPGTGEVTVSTPTGSMDCGYAVRAVNGSHLSDSVSTGWC